MAGAEPGGVVAAALAILNIGKISGRAASSHAATKLLQEGDSLQGQESSSSFRLQGLASLLQVARSMAELDQPVSLWFEFDGDRLIRAREILSVRSGA